MKTQHLLSLALFVAIAPVTALADSKRTAEYLLVNSAEYEGKDVTLDVAFVKPVQWKSPVPELTFFHAMTLDRRDRRPGGHILVAIPAADSAAFAKKYGMDFERGSSDSTTLRGKFLTAPRRGPEGHGGRVWFIDTTGTAQELIKAKKLELEEDRLEAASPGRGGPGGPQGNGMR